MYHLVTRRCDVESPDLGVRRPALHTPGPAPHLAQDRSLLFPLPPGAQDSGRSLPFLKRYHLFVKSISLPLFRVQHKMSWIRRLQEIGVYIYHMNCILSTFSVTGPRQRACCVCNLTVALEGVCSFLFTSKDSETKEIE